MSTAETRKLWVWAEHFQQEDGSSITSGVSKNAVSAVSEESVWGRLLRGREDSVRRRTEAAVARGRRPNAAGSAGRSAVVSLDQCGDDLDEFLLQGKAQL